MGITDRALKSLRRVFGVDREERDKAESPSSDAMRYNPSSTYSIWGREDIGGLLSVSQNLMDRFADYEAMNDYPDIRCFTGDMKVYVVDDNNIIVPTTFKTLATDGDGWEILAFDRKKERIVKVAAENPRLSGRNAPILKLQISNGETLRVTANHKILTKEKGYIEAKDLRKGDFVIGARAGFETRSKSMLTIDHAGGYWITEDPKPDGVEQVYDVTTTTKNLLVNGVFCHNSAFHYFANDSTQPNLDNNRVVWIQSPDEALVDAADTLITRRLRIEDELFSIAYTLCQYGNDIEEVLVTENGVVGLNSLPAPTMRRIEKHNGNLIGFVQDITGRFTANQDELRKMLGGNLEIPKHIALFEDWQVCHFRLRGTARRSPYGVCIPADSLVQTVDGPKPIIDVKIGDRVFCRHAGMLRTTKVIDHVSNGVRPVFKLKTTHREIRATGNHPFLARVGETNRWKPLEELSVGDEIVAATSLPGLGNRPALGRRLRSFSDESAVSLTENGIAALHSISSRGKYGPRDLGLRKLFADQGLTRKQMSDILDGASSLSLNAYKAILSNLGLTVSVGDFEVYHGPAATIPTLPDFVDESFCRFWGFMLGDGWLTDEQVHFARGVDEDVNEFYENYLQSLGLSTSRTNDSTQCYVNSTVLVKTMRDLGWINGCKEKRIPSWAFTQDESLRRAMVQGLVDSDGWCSQQTKERFHIELANYDLVRDIKTLIDGLGWTCGNIRKRDPREGMIRKGLVHYHSGKVQKEDQYIKGGPSYTITWHETPLGEDNFALETIKSIEFDCDEEVFDIGVADTDHNFLCGGLVVHNSTAEGARWIWKRLVMLEDAVMIYKLTRSPARYAFYVDVTDVPSNRVESFLKRAKRDLKKKKMINPNNNFLDMRYNPLANDEDFFIAVRDGRELSRVEVLSGPDYQTVDDVQYFKRMLHGALMVPRSFLGQDEPMQGRSILSNEDVRAGRVSLQVQQELKLGIERLIRIDFAARGFPNPWELDFNVMMTVPSNIYELAAMEVKNARADFAARVQPYVSAQWILDNVFKLSDEEIDVIEKQRRLEADRADKMGMDPLFGAFTGGRPPSPEEQMGQLPPEALPPGVQPTGGAQQPQDGFAGPQAPPQGAPQTAWRQYDRARRLEERRDRSSLRNHNQLVDILGELRQNDRRFDRRFAESQEFMKEFKAATLRTINGRKVAMPAAPQRQFSTTN